MQVRANVMLKAGLSKAEISSFNTTWTSVWHLGLYERKIDQRMSNSTKH
jgi:hypothetical protein